MLEEASIACDVVPAGTRAAGQRPLPALIDGDLEVVGGAAILMDLADRCPDRGLAPPLGTPARAAYYRWLGYVDAVAAPVIEKVGVRTRPPPAAARLPVIDAEARRQLDAICRALAEAVEGRPHVAGAAFTAADIAVGSTVAWLAAFGLLAAHPGLVAYGDRLFERPAYQRTHGLLVRDLMTPPVGARVARVREGRGRPLFISGRPNQDGRGFAQLLGHVDTERPVDMLQFSYAEEEALRRPYRPGEIEGWARDFVGVMRAAQPSGPYHLVGMCEGALIAYQMARLLEAQGETVGLLGILDTWPEENTRRPVLERVHQLEEAARRALEATPAYAGSRLRRAVDRALPSMRRADGDATRRAPAAAAAPVAKEAWVGRHAPRDPIALRPVRCPITVFAAPRQPYWRIRDPGLAWGSRTTGGVVIHPIEGRHLEVLHAPFAEVLGAQLTACLRRLEGR
jgi:glutathione S-transferase